MVVFVGQVGNDFVEREAFQEVDYRRMYGPLTKWVAQIDRAERIPEYVARAYRVPVRIHGIDRHIERRARDLRSRRAGLASRGRRHSGFTRQQHL